MPNKINVGSVEILAVKDGLTDLRDPTVMFPGTTLDGWREFPELLIDGDKIQSRYGTAVVWSGGKLIVVDTGLQTPPGGMLLDELKSNGVDRAAVDIVFMTHIHPDHVGWNLTDGSPTFPNARYLIPRSDFEYWSKPPVLDETPYVQTQVMPLQDLKILDLVDSEYNVTDEIKAMPTPGHTPGHVSLIISSGGERACILGDVAHSPAQAHNTDWNPMFDIQPERSRATRHRVLDMLEAEGILVSAGHFPDPGFGRFVRKSGRRVWQGI